jgi:hypothetical protein
MSRLLLAAAVAGALVLGAAAAAGAADGTPPQITFQLVGTEGSGGWYVSPTTVRWQVGDPESGIKASSGCDATVVGETTGTRLTCAATNFADVTTSVSVTVRVDTTAPAVTGATPDRPPDSDGWYTHAVTFAFAGTDATSGVASCAVVSYAGPDNGEASIGGTCTDAAGNVSAPGAAGFRYDVTPPTLRGVSARAGDGQVTVTWSPLPGSEWVDVARAVAGGKTAGRTIYHGDGGSVVDRAADNGVHYRYAVIAHDEAGHVTEAQVTAMPLGAMRTPPPGARVTTVPTLSWRAAPHAVLYNVQLFRGSHKILSAWPRTAALELGSRWTYAGRARRLTPGTYRWYVWPAYRRGKGVRFGRLVGRSTFVVTA